MQLKKYYIGAIRVGVVLLTVAAFVHYLSKNPELLAQLLHMRPAVIAALLALYVLWFGALLLTVRATLRICKASLPMREELLLNAYSMLVNFFVPGQGGVAVRGLYLKRRHQLSMRQYILATLIYYMIYSIVSVLMLLAPSQPWWQTLLGALFVIAVSAVVVFLYGRHSHARMDVLKISPANLAFLFAATLLQAVVQVSIYAYELNLVLPATTLSQAMTYTGAANFAQFVALTPGAIGIRESFLIFSKSLHQIQTPTILAASILDRSIFLLFLGAVFVVSQAFHAKRSLKM